MYKAEAGQIPVCPYCDTAALKWKNPPDFRGRKGSSQEYYCRKCHEGVAEPQYRPRMGPSNIRGDSLAAKLEQIGKEAER